MKKLETFMLFFVVLVCTSCLNTKNVNSNDSTQTSEWRDNNEADSSSFYSVNESCDKIIGTLKVRSRLHKNLLKNGTFEGGMSSRWLEIKKDSITYFAPNGEIADIGKCDCKNGILKVDWTIRYNRLMEYTIHFNTNDYVELRYYDYPFSFDTFSYDTLKKPTNPTKVVGFMK